MQPDVVGCQQVSTHAPVCPVARDEGFGSQSPPADQNQHREVLLGTSSPRSSDGNASLLDEGGSASQVPQAAVELAVYGSVVWPDSLCEWLGTRSRLVGSLSQCNQRTLKDKSPWRLGRCVTIFCRCEDPLHWLRLFLLLVRQMETPVSSM